MLLIPLLIILGLYIAIPFNLRSDKMVTCLSAKAARQWKKRNRNLQRMAIATVTAFLICWALFIAISFIKLFSSETVPKYNRSFKILDYISRVLASSYCVVNPCICSILVRSFSREQKNMCNTAYFEQIVHHQRGQLWYAYLYIKQNKCQKKSDAHAHQQSLNRKLSAVICRVIFLKMLKGNQLKEKIFEC